MNLTLLIANLPALIKAGESIAAVVTAIVAAIRASDPGGLEGVTDAQIIAKLIDDATTGIAHADALIERLRAGSGDGDPTA